MTTRDTDWDGVRLHVVTGKGGTGKTTVAAALALALASAGRRVLLIEVEGRQGLARLFDCPPLPYEERKVAIGLGAQGSGQGGDVYALAVDPEGALLDYMEMLTNAHKLILIPCLYLHLEAEQLQCPGLQRKAAGMLT